MFFDRHVYFNVEHGAVCPKFSRSFIFARVIFQLEHVQLLDFFKVKVLVVCGENPNHWYLTPGNHTQ